MMETSGALMHIKKSSKLTQDVMSRASILGTPIKILGSDGIRINENVYDLTPEVYKALTSTSFSGKTMKEESIILMMDKIINDLSYTGVGDRDSKRKTFFTIGLPERVEDNQNKAFDEIDLEGQGVKIIIASNIIGIYDRLKGLLGLKLSGHTDT